ncbi:acyltransferase family protein [Deinococcus yunweiensis]|uniref:acyltransferase family protein n=1 Tax=Deinococcus yunweiensis TaxID=367282 RepID=UPI00398E80B5
MTPADPLRANNFDFLRFMGALLVVVSHATFVPTGSLWADPLYARSGGQMTIGWVGVGMFFVMSGYLVTLSWQRRPSVRAFAAARALRLYPALIAVVISVFVVGAVISTDDAYLARQGAWSYLFNVVLPFVENQLPGVFRDQPARTVTDNFWTLRYEIGAYALLAGLGALGLWRRSVVLALFVFTTGLFALGGEAAESGWLDLPRYFLSGALLCLHRDRVPWRGLLALASLVGMAALALTGGMKLGFSVFGAYLTLYLAQAPWLKLHHFARFGDFSYGLYLVGFFVQQLVQRAAPGLTALGNFALSVPLALALAALLWFAVERPALRLKARFTVGGERSA